MRSHYWCCSKFADWLRGTPKPGAATSEGWDEWTETATKAHPFRYWLADDALRFVERAFYYPTDKLYDLKYYINNRFITRTHCLSASPKDIKPGQWCDVGNRFLPCLFNELVDFIEVETAWHHIAWGDEKKKAKYNAPFWSTGWFRWRTWRCPQAGLDHLAWEMTLVNDEWLDPTHKDYGKPTQQAVKAKELKALYDWWTVTRPARPDPYEASGWSAICDARRARAEAEGKKSRLFGSDDKTPAEKKATTKALKDLRKIEAAYEKEDEEMMIRLIKVRHGLWT
jgi:hypothetical protein